MMRTSGLAVLFLWLVPSLLLGGNEPKASGVEAIQAKHDRALVKDLLAYVAVDPTADDSESAYQTIFNKIISHDWFTEHETFANRYLLDHPEGSVRPLARIVATMARAEAGSYDEALTSFNALLSGLNTADQVEFASNFAENLANSATSAGEFATARKVYASLLKKFGDESPSLNQKVGEALAKLDRIGKPDWRAVKMVSSSKVLSATLQETQRTGDAVGYLLKVSIRPDAHAGAIRDEIIIQTNDQESPSFPILVTAQIRGDLAATPGVLNLGAASSSGLVTGRYIVRASKPFKIVSLEGSGDGFSIAKADDNAKPLHILTVSFKPEESKLQGELQHKFKITTDLTEEAPLEVISTLRINP